MKIFEKAFDKIFLNEGGYVNDATDPGGATNYGISLRFLKGLPLHEADINFDRVIDIDDIKALKTEDAKRLYQKHFWKRFNLDKILNDNIAIKIADTVVNMGSQGIKIAQEAANCVLDDQNCARLFDQLTVDGIMGPKTINALNKVPAKYLLMYYQQIQANFYHKLIKKNPNLKKFIGGWIKRAHS